MARDPPAGFRRRLKALRGFDVAVRLGAASFVGTRDEIDMDECARRPALHIPDLALTRAFDEAGKIYTRITLAQGGRPG